MAFKQKDGTRALFRNEDKTEGDNRPNAKGRAKIAGVRVFRRRVDASFSVRGEILIADVHARIGQWVKREA
jgi:hypothetical protein